MSIDQNITPFPLDAPNSDTQGEGVFNTNANSFAGHVVDAIVPQVNTWSGQANATRVAINNIKTETEALRNQASVSAGASASSASASATSAGQSSSFATASANSAANAQNVVNGLGDTQYALAQIGLGFAALSDGDLVVTYANPITNVSLSNGELSITF